MAVAACAGERGAASLSGRHARMEKEKKEQGVKDENVIYRMGMRWYKNRRSDGLKVLAGAEPIV